MVRALVSHTRGRRFKSYTAHHFPNPRRICPDIANGVLLSIRRALPTHGEGRSSRRSSRKSPPPQERAGADPEANPRLRVAVLKAKAENMTKENIERAIKRGASAAEGGEAYEEYTYEGYGPRGTAVLVEALTDNKNRTTAEVRHIFSRHNGNLGESGSVSWIFSKKGYLAFDKQAIDEDRIMELALEAGAEDVREDEDTIEVITELISLRVREEGLR